MDETPRPAFRGKTVPTRILERCSAALLVLACLPAQAAVTGFLAGAARTDTTPPPFDAAQDAADFPLCPAAAFPGPRPFRFEEPYVDNDGDGRFTYGSDTWCDYNRNGRWDGIFISGGIDHQAQCFAGGT